MEESRSAAASAAAALGSHDDVCKHVSAVMAGHIAPLEEFSSLAVAAWQTGGVAPRFPLAGGSITALICQPLLVLMCESKTCCAY